MLSLAFGCVPHSSLLSPLTFAPTIAILPPNNRTDDPLIVAGDVLWNAFASQSRRVTVPDILAEEVKVQLEQRGFIIVPTPVVEAMIGDHTPSSLKEATELIAQKKIEGNALYIEITHWEPDTSLHPRRVLVSLKANLIEGTTGRVIWSIHQPLRPVPTPGAANQWAAYMITARQVAEQLLRSWDHSDLSHNG